MNTIISLGNSCKVRHAIQRHLKTNTLETNMFDWVLSNFESVLYFIRHIDKPLVKDDFYATNLKCFPHRVVKHVNIRFDTLHDVIFDNPYETEIDILVDKYNRRLKRLKDIILSNKKIHFIHVVDVDYNYNLSNYIDIPSLEEISTFNKIIKNINTNCIYYLHILIPPQDCKYYKKKFNYDKTEVEKLAGNNIFVYFLTQIETLENYTDFCSHWSWYDVFKNIEIL